MSGHESPALAAPVPAAWVVFCDSRELAWNELIWLRLLRPGFRHCFVVLQQRDEAGAGPWVTIDPLAPLLEVSVAPVPPDYDLPGWLAAAGHVVVPAPVRRGLRRPAPWAPFTCVETVKRVLGLHACLVVTPWQLFRHLAAAGSAPVAVAAP